MIDWLIDWAQEYDNIKSFVKISGPWLASGHPLYKCLFISYQRHCQLAMSWRTSIKVTRIRFNFSLNSICILLHVYSCTFLTMALVYHLIKVCVGYACMLTSNLNCCLLNFLFFIWETRNLTDSRSFHAAIRNTTFFDLCNETMA